MKGINENIKSGDFELSKGHKPFIKVPKGGSSCANCKFLSEDKLHCVQKDFVEWYGTSKLPQPIDEYCSDWYEPNEEMMAKGGELKFYSDCVGYPVLSDLEHIIDKEKEITYKTFVANVNKEDRLMLEQRLGYGKHFPITKDWHVRFFRSKDEDNNTVYFMRHSAIEYVFSPKSSFCQMDDDYKNGGQIPSLSKISDKDKKYIDHLLEYVYYNNPDEEDEFLPNEAPDWVINGSREYLKNKGITKIYRGVKKGSYQDDDAFSWTYDMEVAKFFAKENGKILEKQLPKDVISIEFIFDWVKKQKNYNYSSSGVAEYVEQFDGGESEVIVVSNKKNKPKDELHTDSDFEINYETGDYKHGGTLYNGIRVPETVNPRMVISAFANPIDDNKVEEYTNIMKEMMLSHDFPPITGFPTEITENDIGDYFLSGEEITEEHVGKRAWKVWDGHHRTLAAINANLPYIEVELEYSAVTDMDEYLKNGGKLNCDFDKQTKSCSNACNMENGGQLPSIIKYARIKPIREGGEERIVRVSPDEVGGYVAGYVVYYPAKSNNKVAYFNKAEFKLLLDDGSYTLFNTLEQAQSIKPMEIDIDEQLKIRQRMRSLLKLLKYKTTDESGITKEDKFIDRVIQLIYDGKDFKSKSDIERIAENEFGLEDKRKVRELTEYAVLSVGRDISRNYGNNILVAYKKMVSLYSNQPYSTHRTGTSVNLGQFSTPLPMAYLMGCYVGINIPSDKIYFEPTGGNGSLTVAGNVQDFVINELDMHRYNNLLKENYKLVLNQDATKKFDFDFKFDGMLANPPFATTKTDIIVGGFHISGLEQQIIVNSLMYLKDKAKIAFIIGGHTEFDEEGRIKSKKDRAFLSYLFKHYYMDDVININGSLYGRQGTTYPIRIILLAAKKSEPNGFYPLRNEALGKFEPFSVKVIDTFDELFKRTEKYIQKSL